MGQEGYQPFMNEFNEKMEEKRLLALEGFLDKVKKDYSPENIQNRRRQLLEIFSSMDLDLNDLKKIAERFNLTIALDAQTRPKNIVDALLPPAPIETDSSTGQEDDTELDILHTDDTLVPTDGNHAGIQKKEDEAPFKEKETMERVKMLIDFLHEYGIESNQYTILKGKNKPNMMRKESYTLVMIPSLQSMVLVCDEVENTTFVIRDLPEDPSEYYDLTKDELKSHPKVARQINWSNKKNWTEKILDALTDPNDTFNKKEIKKEFLTLEQLKQAVQATGVNNIEKYHKARKDNPDWPSAPGTHYDSWIDWLDLFGKERIEFLTLESLKQAVHEASVDSYGEYKEAQKNHPDWPCSPNATYKDKGWVDWPNLFGKERVELLSLEDLRQAVRNEGVESPKKYKKTRKNHPEWPSNPNKIYKKKGWIDWPDLFGKERKKFLTLETLKQAVHEASVDNKSKYLKAQKDHPEWPSTPDETYRGKGWVDWPNLFGKERVEFLTLEALKQSVHEASVDSSTKYRQAQKNHPEWPSNPDTTYKDKGWVDWPNLWEKEK